MTLVCDTSVLFAALDPRERWHDTCTELLDRSAVVIPAAVLVEVDWLARSRTLHDATGRLLASVLDRSVALVDLDESDYERARMLLRQYADLPLEFVDAAVVAVAERLEQTRVATLDHRHFSVVKPLHCERFTLVP